MSSQTLSQTQKDQLRKMLGECGLKNVHLEIGDILKEEHPEESKYAKQTNKKMHREAKAEELAEKIKTTHDNDVKFDESKMSVMPIDAKYFVLILNEGDGEPDMVFENLEESDQNEEGTLKRHSLPKELKTLISEKYNRNALMISGIQWGLANMINMIQDTLGGQYGRSINELYYYGKNHIVVNIS